MSTRAGLVALLLAVFAACGGDDGGSNTNNVCGDGVKAGSEQCDDGNTTSGDGCDSVCHDESTTTCGDGETQVATEQCDDGNTADGDGCSSTCMNECGNGQLDGQEMCDDGNAANDDGCTSQCQVEPLYTCTGEPSVCVKPTGACNDAFTVALTNNAGALQGTGSGNTTGGMDQVGEAACDGIDSGGGNDHIWKLVIPDTRDVTITIDPSTPFDAVLRLTTTPCDVLTEFPEYLGADGCSDLGVEAEGEQMIYLALPAGTYYIVIDGYDNTSNGMYMFSVDAVPTTCGDGLVQGVEGCDDGANMGSDGCTARCDVEEGYACTGMPSVCAIACGNGLLDTDEGCDDGDTMAGDGCDAMCQVEPGYSCDDSEPSVCELSCGNGELDTGEECEDGNNLAGDRCSATCTLEYDVMEVEPNDAAASAQVVSPTNHWIRGALPAGDVDLYTFTLAVPSTVEFETYTAMNNLNDYLGVGTIPNIDCLGGADTILHVFDANGDVAMDTTAIIEDDEDGDLSCSYVGPNDDDGNTMEGVLPAGTYTIKVANYFSTDALDYYILDMKVVPQASAPVAGDLVMNEFMAADNVSDTNCDGSTTDTVDEFIELVNVSNKTLDLTGVTISDSVQVRATLSYAATHGASSAPFLLPGKALVVWGGGAPACAGVTNWFLAGSSQLGLNDGGDTITVKTAAAATLLTRTFGSQTINKSSNLNPDLTGTVYALHDTITGHVGNFSPGKKVDGTAF